MVGGIINDVEIRPPKLKIGFVFNSQNRSNNVRFQRHITFPLFKRSEFRLSQTQRYLPVRCIFSQYTFFRSADAIYVATEYCPDLHNNEPL